MRTNRIIILLTCMIIGSCYVLSQNVVPHWDNNSGKWGFAYEDGSILIAPKYDNIVTLSSKFYKVRIKDKVALFNLQGEMVVKPKYNDIVYNGRDLKVTKGNKVGILDSKTFKEIIPCKLLGIDDPLVWDDEIYYIVRDIRGIGLVKSNGRWILECDEYNDKFSYVRDLNLVIVEDNHYPNMKKIVSIDKGWRLWIVDWESKKFQTLEILNFGAADPELGNLGTPFNPNYDAFCAYFPSNQHLQFIRSSEGTCYLIHRDAKIENIGRGYHVYGNTGYFFNYVPYNIDGKIYDKNGNVVVENTFPANCEELGRGWFAINGARLCSPDFREYDSYRNEFRQINTNMWIVKNDEEKWWVLQRNEGVDYSNTYEEFTSLDSRKSSNKYYVAKKNGKWSILDENLKPQMDYIFDTNPEFVIGTEYKVCQNGKVGLYNIATKSYTIDFDKNYENLNGIITANNGKKFLKISRGDKLGIYDLSARKEIIPISATSIKFYERGQVFDVYHGDKLTNYDLNGNLTKLKSSVVGEVYVRNGTVGYHVDFNNCEGKRYKIKITVCNKNGSPVRYKGEEISHEYNHSVFGRQDYLQDCLFISPEALVRYRHYKAKLTSKDENGNVRVLDEMDFYFD